MAEQLSHELALRFAKKCFTPLEVTHFKDVFRSLADEQNDIQYWKEETLCRFLALPDSLGSGPLVYQMACYLGSFPFPSLAPSILTIEAMLKVVVIMTERYGKILRRGKADRNKLLFRSLAVFDRRLSSVNEKSRQELMNSLREEKFDQDKTAVDEPSAGTAGFSIDLPSNDMEDDDVEEDDDLALAALETLDALEVFKHDQRAEAKTHRAQIPVDNFQSRPPDLLSTTVQTIDISIGMIMLLLLIAPLNPQEHIAKYAENLSESRLEGLRRVANNILWAFDPDKNAGIFYHSFNIIVTESMPFMFDGLNPLFEHFLFSKNMDLSQRRRPHDSSDTPPATVSQVPGVHLNPVLMQEGEILNIDTLSQLSFFLGGSSVFRRLRPLYLGGEAGFSMGSFEQSVFNWRAPNILLVAGSRLPHLPQGSRERAFADKLPPKRFFNGASGNNVTERVVFGAYLDVPWKRTNKEPIGSAETLLFQLEPIHEVFRASTINKNYATCSRSGVTFGCSPPRSKPVSGLSSHITLGAVSLVLDESLEFGVFTHDSEGGGSFHSSQSRKIDWQDRFEVESLEVWGCGGEEESEKQRAAWVFEAREAEARKNLKLGKDIEADRALLEMAGLVGNHNASGGSMG